MYVCTAAEIAEKRRIALERLRAKNSNTASNGNQKESIVSPKIYTPPAAQPNSIKAALDALKRSSKLSFYSGQRGNVRASTHPYQRPNSSNVSKVVRKLESAFTNPITLQLYMVNPTRFCVQPCGYHAKLIDIFETIPSKSYDSNTQIWSFGLKDYKLMQQRVVAMKSDVVIGTTSKKVLDLCAAPIKSLDRSCLASIEKNLADKLMTFQQEGVCFAIAKNGRIMICDEMGLGKTYQAIAIADYYRKDWPLLICTTASTRESWSSHIRELLPSLPNDHIHVLTSNDKYFGDARVLIVSYAMLANNVSKLVEHNFTALIFDESHHLKNYKAKCSKAAELLARKARRVILLSGTPALSRPLELFTQLRLIDRYFMGFKEFTSRYCAGKQREFGWDAKGQSNLQELNVMLKLKFMIRRTKADVLPDMVVKNREKVTLNPALLWTNDGDKETLNKFAEDFSASKGIEKEEILFIFYARTAAVKLRAVCSYLKTIVREEKKFIVFAHHRIMMDAICECLNKLDVNFIRIDGQTKNDTRAEYIETFQTQSKCQVAVLSLRACYAGITLTAAEIIIFAELYWNPSTLAQAESRAHRIGQDKEVTCRYLMATETADDVIWNILKNKQDVLNRAGLFCENLQDARHTAAPTTSNKIDRYFSPNKSRNTVEEDAKSPVSDQTENINKPLEMEQKPVKALFELDDVNGLFNDDDDVFNDIIC